MMRVRIQTSTSREDVGGRIEIVVVDEVIEDEDKVPRGDIHTDTWILT